MASPQPNQTVRTTFNKGFLTEFSELNFPSEASTSELNCSLHKGGNRSKRLGVEYESGYELTGETYAEGTLFGTHSWVNVGGDPNLEYLVVQTGNKLRFFQKGMVPLSSGVVTESLVSTTPYILDLSAHAIPGGLGAGGSHLDCTSINGYLIVASPQIKTLYIWRNPADGVFTVREIPFRIRDFGWFGDPDFRTINVGTSGVTTARIYDTLNCGWVGTYGDAALTTYLSSDTAYPPLTHPWYSGKDSSGNFSLTEWKKVFTGNSVTANGHFIIDLFNPDRDTVSGLTGVTTYYNGDPIDSPTTRFSAVTSYAGRVFYSGIDSKVYFSKIVENPIDFGELLQVNDPTSEESPDLLDTDGGWVQIQDAVGIKKLHVFGSSLLVFAENGVWRISGVDGVFRASEYSVYKVTDNGLAIKSSFVSGSSGQPFWWSYVGIHSVEVTQEGGMVEVNLTKDTIKKYIDEISGDARSSLVGTYDSLQNRCLWFFSHEGETREGKLNKVLNLDLDLGAFYPWEITDVDASQTPYIVGISFYKGRGSQSVEYTVVDSDLTPVTDSLGNTVVVTRTSGLIQSSSGYLLVRDTSGSLTFAKFTDAGFKDWGVADYDAYVESSYNFIGDLGRRKTSPYITVFLKQTETGWTGTSETGFSPIRESSLKVSAYWDFKNIPATASQQAYRLKYVPIVDETSLGTFNYPKSVIQSRLKLRGRGRVVKLRFDAEAGKDFNLLGWETFDLRNAGY